MPSRKSSTPCKAKARRPAAPPSSAASPAAISGPAARPTAPRHICQFCDTDFVGTDGPGGGKFDVRGRACRRHRGEMAGASSAQALRRLHRRRAAAATRRGLDRRAPRARLSSRRRDQRHHAAARRASTGSASAPRPAPTGSQRSGDELKLVYPQAGADPAELRRRSPSGTSSCSRWTVRAARPTPPALRLLPRPSALAAEPANPQADRLAIKADAIVRLCAS